jgi:hypothetical protein
MLAARLEVVDQDNFFIYKKYIYLFTLNIYFINI